MSQVLNIAGRLVARSFPALPVQQHGQGGAIARSQALMARIGVPTVACVIGEGGSGGAVALAAANRVLIEDGDRQVPMCGDEITEPLLLEATRRLSLGLLDLPLLGRSQNGCRCLDVHTRAMRHLYLGNRKLS